MKDPLDSLPPIPAGFRCPPSVPESYEFRGAMTAEQHERWTATLAAATCHDPANLPMFLEARGLRLSVAEEKHALDNPTVPSRGQSDHVLTLAKIARLVECHAPDLMPHVRAIFDGLPEDER